MQITEVFYHSLVKKYLNMLLYVLAYFSLKHHLQTVMVSNRVLINFYLQC